MTGLLVQLTCTNAHGMGNRQEKLEAIMQQENCNVMDNKNFLFFNFFFPLSHLMLSRVFRNLYASQRLLEENKPQDLGVIFHQELLYWPFSGRVVVIPGT